jgi:hypothetical protein
MRRTSLLLACWLAAGSVSRAADGADALFDFHSNPWMNLHHILWARGEGIELPADMPEAERKVWSEAIEGYAPYSKRNLLFDAELWSIKETLRTAGARTDLDGVTIADGAKAPLERSMRVYRKRLWPAHDATNRAWIAAARKLLDRHGATLDRAIARVYEVTPDNPVWVDVAVVSHALGAYTTSRPTHVTISSTHPGYAGYAALEMLFHERSHAWGRKLFEEIQQAAEAQSLKVPPQLSHAVLFYIAGALTARELSAHGIAYEHYGRSLYDKMCRPGCAEKLALYWGPYLEGKRERADALASFVASFR